LNYEIDKDFLNLHICLILKSLLFNFNLTIDTKAELHLEVPI